MCSLSREVGALPSAKAGKLKPDSPPDYRLHPSPPCRTDPHGDLSLGREPRYLPQPPQHNDPQERTQAKTRTYLWSMWGRSSLENTHTQTPVRSPCNCLCCGRDQRDRRAPLQKPGWQSARDVAFGYPHLSSYPGPPPGPPAQGCFKK